MGQLERYINSSSKDVIRDLLLSSSEEGLGRGGSG